MANNQIAKRGRGRPPKPPIDRYEVVADWQDVPLLCDVGMVARIVGKQYEATRRLFVSGELPGFQIGCEWRIRKDALMAYLGYQPWEIARYGFSMPVDRRERLQDELEAGQQMMRVIKEEAG